MKIGSTLLGLLVLALVVAGVLWVRSHPSMSGGGSAGQTAPAPVSAVVDESLPDVTLADATADAGDVRITLSIAQRPAIALAKTRVRVSAFALAPAASASASATADKRLTLEGGRISFEMTMPMGDHRYTLVPGENGWQEAEVVLPLCRSGNRRWYAIVEGTVAGRPRVARFRLELAPPG
jgi:hypothetical protein